MKAWKMNVRLVVLIAAVCCLAGVRTQTAQAQTVTTTPPNLSFGVPSVGSVSIAQAVTISATGSGTATVSGITIGGGEGSNPGDFSQTNTCTSPITAPGFCAINVTFTAGATGLRSATLSFNYIVSVGGGEGMTTVNVPLTGAAGAIKLFGPTLEAVSNPNATLSNPFTYGSTTLNLSCPAENLTASFSSSPDGTGFVLEDNYLTLAVNGTAAPTGFNPTGNVCSGGPADNNNGTLLNDCFTTNYQVPAGAGQLNGDDPDTYTNPGNTVLFVQDDNPNNAGGLPPINISSFLPSGASTATISLLDGGGFVAGATLFLVTDCTQTGVAPGGTIVSDPINSGDPGSLTPNFPFDGTGGQHIFFDANYLAGTGSGATNNGVTIQPNTVASVKDIGVSQADFAGLVAGSSAGPAVCLRLTGELAPDGTELCKGYRIECISDTNPIPAGANCAQSTLRNLLYESRFDSDLDFPPGSNPIYPGTGPGFVMGPDNWTDPPCVFTPGTEFGQLCPQDLLTEFYGAADPIGGGTTRGTNSTIFAVKNMPLPIALSFVTSENIFLWQNSFTVKVKFISSPAIYPLFGNPLPANGFTPAPIQSVTFGTNPASATPSVPDTTFPVPNDVTLFNPGGVGGSSQCPGAPGGLFNPSDTLTADTSTGKSFQEGRYILHFFATDCASTEGLRFTQKTSPMANWASFYTVPINIDATPPALSVVSATRSGKILTVTYSCSDPVLQGDGSPGSGVVICGTHLFFAVATTPTVTSKFTVKASPGSISLTTTDLAGNTQTVSVPYN